MLSVPALLINTCIYDFRYSVGGFFFFFFHNMHEKIAYRVVPVCASIDFNSRAAERILVKFGMNVRI
jgi:hypothetical protein